jgi:transposase
MTPLTGQHLSSNRVKGLAPADVRPWVCGAEVALMGQTNVRLIEFLGIQIGNLETAAQAKVKLLPSYQRLQELPGVGKILALVMMLETGPVARFASAGHYVSYCRGVKSERLSNEHKKGENNRKCGNRYLDWAFVAAANFAIRHYPEVRRWYQRKLHRCGGKAVIALKAVAAKLAKAAYYLLKNDEPFQMKRIFA